MNHQYCSNNGITHLKITSAPSILSLWTLILTASSTLVVTINIDNNKISNNKLFFGLIYCSHVKPYHYRMFTITDAYEKSANHQLSFGSIDTRMDKHTHRQKKIIFFINNFYKICHFFDFFHFNYLLKDVKFLYKNTICSQI